MEVTIVEPCALVVVTFANVVGPVFVFDVVGLLELLLSVSVENGLVEREGALGPVKGPVKLIAGVTS